MAEKPAFLKEYKRKVYTSIEQPRTIDYTSSLAQLIRILNSNSSIGKLEYSKQDNPNSLKIVLNKDRPINFLKKLILWLSEVGIKLTVTEDGAKIVFPQLRHEKMKDSELMEVFIREIKFPEKFKII